MFFVIVTCRSLFWVLCSVGTFMLSITAMATPKWLVGEEKAHLHIKTNNSTTTSSDSIGLYNKCMFMYYRRKYQQRCFLYALNFGEISGTAWRACIIFLSIAIVFLGIASIFAVTSFCKQLIRRKSLMNLAGIMQAFAGILLIVAVILFPLGWDNDQVQKMCHETSNAKKFKLGSCSVGIAYYAAIGTMFAAFFCSLFSFVADKAVFSDKVQDEILDGKHLICVP